MQKSWLILPNHMIACINMGLKIVSGKWILCKAGDILSDELTASFLTLFDLAAEYFGRTRSDHLCARRNQGWLHEVHGLLAKLEAIRFSRREQE